MQLFSPRTLVAALVLQSLGALAACVGDAGVDAADGGGDGHSGEFSVLSYNVAGLPQEFSNEQPGEHLPLISPLLNAYDIVLTQEDFDWWSSALDTFDFVHYHERLRKDVTHPYQSAPHPGPEAAKVDLSLRPAPLVGDGLGILSRMAFDNGVRVPWRNCFGGADGSDQGAGDCLAMKGFMVARFALSADHHVDIYTLHVEAGGTEKDQALQSEDMIALAAYIEEHSASHAVILAGDTNLHTGGDHPDSSGKLDGELWAKFLEDTDLRDSCAELDCGEPGAIDKLAFRDGDGVTLTALTHRFETKRFVGEDGEALSDHQALAVTFSWAAAK